MSRYEAGVGDEFEPGSNGRVLRNRLGITDPRDADELETVLLAKAYSRSLDLFETNTVFDSALIRDLHWDWLKGLYDFAGELRIVDVSKGGFLFAKAEFLPQGLSVFDALLARETPCAGLSRSSLGFSIAVVHAEFEFLHPFREGNGRLRRWIADLMAAQAGYPPLEWQFAVPGRRSNYLAALRRGFLKDYRPLTELVEGALR